MRNYKISKKRNIEFNGFYVSHKKIAPISQAIITKGGVSTLEINPSTMESKKVNGLYFCGEVIDVNGANRRL